MPDSHESDRTWVDSEGRAWRVRLVTRAERERKERDGRRGFLGIGRIKAIFRTHAADLGHLDDLSDYELQKLLYRAKFGVEQP